MILDKGVAQTTRLVKVLLKLELIEYRSFFDIIRVIKLSPDNNTQVDGFNRELFNNRHLSDPMAK